MYGVKNFAAVINPPQVGWCDISKECLHEKILNFLYFFQSCILAVGQTEKRIIADDNTEQGYDKKMFVN